MVTYLRPVFLAHLGEFDQHGKIDSCEHFDLRAAHTGNRKVAGRAAEHVGQDSHTIATVDAIYLCVPKT